MKQTFYFIVFLLAMVNSSNAQRLSVESFNISQGNPAAIENERKDLNDVRCALIMVQTAEEITDVEGNVIKPFLKKGNDTWVYMTQRSRQMKIITKENFPLMVTFEDYGIPTLKSGVTYILKLTKQQASDGSSEASTAEFSSSNDILMVMKAAKDGNANAQHELGIRYYRGEGGVVLNYQEAFRWFQESANKGHLYSKLSLGECYKHGYGVGKDGKKATSLFTEILPKIRKLAEEQNPKALYYLGYIYEQGYGVSISDEEAVKWYKKAAEKGYMQAICDLGYYYANGLGVKQSYTEAVKWYTKAAELGDTDAMFMLGTCYTNGQGVKQSHTEAVKWYKKASELGNPDAQYNLGVCYFNGYGVMKSEKEALRLFKKAAKQGQEDAINNLKSIGITNYD